MVRPARNPLGRDDDRYKTNNKTKSRDEIGRMVMANSSVQRPYKGVFPVVPTVFDGDGRLDLDGQKRAVDFMIDAGSHGLCILANFSEQFVLTDAERDLVLDAVLKHVAGRVPVIVTTTHFASHICAERSKRAEQAGAAMVMVMPPYHGATVRVRESGIHEFYRAVSDAIPLPIMTRDPPGRARRCRRLSSPAW